MSQLQWILLVVGVLVIGGVYWYTRRTGRPDYYDDVPRLDEVEGDPDDHDEVSWRDDPDLIDWPEDQADNPPTLHEPKSEPEPDPEPDVMLPPPREARPSRRPPPAREAAAEPRGWFQRIGDSLRREPAGPGGDAPPQASAEKGTRMPRPPQDDEKLVVLHVMAGEGEGLYGEDIHVALEACKLQFGPRHIYHRIKEVDGVPESVFSVANSLKPGYLDPAESDQLVTRGLSLFMIVPGPEQAVPAFRDMLDTANSLAKALGAEVHDENRQPLTRQMAQFIQEEVAEVERHHQMVHLQGQ